MIHLDRVYTALSRLKNREAFRGFVTVSPVVWEYGVLWTVAVHGGRELCVCHPDLRTVFREFRRQLKTKGLEPCLNSSATRSRQRLSPTALRRAARTKGKDAHVIKTLEPAR